MLQGEHSAILSTFIKLPFAIKIFVLWPFTQTLLYMQSEDSDQTKHLHSLIKVSKGAKIKNRYNQVPHLTQDTNEKEKTHS